jgi:2-polyprenyl-6-methoxyphenol hydroxylase-like FAD-dependent oxidoreductase
MGTHAVVIGASMAGLSAARVLADRFGSVTVLDRDDLPADAVPRRGVPQGRHGHVLLVSGLRALTELFPGLPDDLIAAGATRMDTGADMVVYRFGRRWRTAPTGLVLISQSRPQLEAIVRARVMALPRVTVKACAAVSALTGDPGRITGVRLDDGETLTADLVVDASGRGSRSDRWLSALDLPVPEQIEIKIGIAYSTRLYKRVPGEWPGFRGALVLPDPRSEQMAGMVLPIEGDRWLVTLLGFFDEPMPQDHDAFLAYARSLPVPDIYETIRDCEPQSEIKPFRFAGSLRQHYERLDRLPEGLIALGDAVCSFNPVYGQGMTVGAIEAESLGQTLAKAQAEGGIGMDFGRRWFQAITPVVDAAWKAVRLEDFRFPELARLCPLHLRPLQWYMDRVQRATHHSAFVTDQFYRVMNFLEPPTKFFSPRMIAEVLVPSFCGAGHSAALGSAPAPRVLETSRVG